MVCLSELEDVRISVENYMQNYGYSINTKYNEKNIIKLIFPLAGVVQSDETKNMEKLLAHETPTCLGLLSRPTDVRTSPLISFQDSLLIKCLQC